MFQGETGFGGINKPNCFWCEKGIRPSVPCHYIREYCYAYGVVETLIGDGYFLVMPYCNTGRRQDKRQFCQDSQSVKDGRFHPVQNRNRISGRKNYSRLPDFEAEE